MYQFILRIVSLVEEKIAKFVSYLFHPLLMPVYGTLLLFSIPLDGFFTIPFIFQLFILLMVLVSTLLMPLAGTLLMLKNGHIKSLQLSEKEERRIPLLLTTVFYLLNFYLLNQLTLLPSTIRIFLFGTCIGIVITMVIGFFWKISIHLVGVGGMVGLLIGLSLKTGSNIYEVIVASILISGIVGFARLKLNTHSPAQLYTGFLLGVTSELGLFLFFT